MIECSCIDAEIDDYVKVLSDKIVISRKKHQCGECNCFIQPGQSYRVEKILYENNYYQEKTCLDCNSLREHLVCSFQYSDIWRLIEDEIFHMNEDIPWARISRLTPIARNKVLKLIEDYWELYLDDEEDHY